MRVVAEILERSPVLLKSPPEVHLTSNTNAIDDQLLAECKLLLKSWNSLRPNLLVRYSISTGLSCGTCEVLAKRMRPCSASVGLFAILLPIVVVSAFVNTATFVLVACIFLTLAVSIPWYLASQPEEALFARLSGDGRLNVLWKGAEASGLTKDSFSIHRIHGFDFDMTSLYVLVASSTNGGVYVIAFSQLRPAVEHVRAQLASHLEKSRSDQRGPR